MLSRISLTMKAIWRKMKSKEYREAFVAAQISNTISAQIHTMRQVRGWTQNELASRCDMRQPRISALEDPDFDNVEIGTLRRVASAFDVGLIVRFAPFSEVARLSSSMKPSDFNVEGYEKDSLLQAVSPAVRTQFILSAPAIHGAIRHYGDFNLPDLGSFEIKIEALPLPSLDLRRLVSTVH